MALTQEQLTKMAKDMKRQLYLLRVLQFTNEAIILDPNTPKCLLPSNEKLHKRMKQHVQSLQKFANGKIEWDSIVSDLQKDQLHDISLILDEVSDIKDMDKMLSAVVMIKRECFKPEIIAPCSNEKN